MLKLFSFVTFLSNL